MPKPRLLPRLLCLIFLITASAVLHAGPPQSPIVASASTSDCTLMDHRSALAAYDQGGPFDLDHFRLTEGRLGIREFLWDHWHSHRAGVTEARVGTVDAGTVRVLYIIRPNSAGALGIDVVLKRERDAACVTFHADSIVRLPIEKPDEDYPSQTLGFWPPDRLPKKLVPDEETEPAKLYQIQLVVSGKPIGDVL